MIESNHDTCYKIIWKLSRTKNSSLVCFDLCFIMRVLEKVGRYKYVKVMTFVFCFIYLFGFNLFCFCCRI